MKSILWGIIWICIFLFFACSRDFSPLTTEYEEKTLSAEIFVAYDEPPSPIGGLSAIQKALIYPQSAIDAKLEGRVVVNCLIDTMGLVKKTSMLVSLSNDCDNAAINAIKSIHWLPAKCKNKPVNVWIGIPVVFRLPE